MKTVRLLTPIVVAMLLFHNVAAQDWSQWRGPRRDGSVEPFKQPKRWPERLTQKWKVAVGGGYSSPVVAGTNIFVHSRNEENEVVSSIDLQTGKTLWSKSYPVAFSKNQYAVQMGKGPNSTPVVHRGRLYTLGVSGILSSFDTKTGELRWRKDFSVNVDTSKLFCGTAMSPIIDGERLIVHVGDDRRGWVKAFNLANGNEIWAHEGDGPGYASPIVVELDGVRQLVTLTDKSIISVASDSGKLLWRIPYTDEWNENIVTPILYQKMLIISGVRRGTMAVQIARNGDKWETRQVWQNPKIAMYMSSPVLIGDSLYGLSHLNKGQFFCLDARTGQTLWITEGRQGQNAAVLRAGSNLLFLTSDADLIVVHDSRKAFEKLAKYDIADSATWSHPVLIGNQLLIKDSSALALWTID
jgi:outer membrane protein assembly factor BamB